MKNKIKSLAVLALLVFAAFTQVANAQSLQLDIRNQEYVGNGFYFDVYLSRNGGSTDYYLGNADFVLTFNNANFTTPTLNYIAYSSDLKDHSGDSITTYETNLATAIGTSGANTNKLLINLLQPVFSNQTEFENRIARIDNSTITHKLGRFYITGVSNINQTANLTWVMSGGGLKTGVFTLNTSTPWKSSKISSYTANNPTLSTQPGTQPTALDAISKTDVSIALSWDRGNGGEVIILAKSGSAVGTDLPTDGMLYTAVDTFGSGSQIGSTGVYVVYRGTDTTVNVLGLDPATTYHFAALELNGDGGYSENYNLSSVDTTSETTTESEPLTSASNLSVIGYTTSTLELSWTNGSGSNRIVVAKSGSAVDANPTDATTYSASADFTAGTDLGSGNIVVYNGNDTTVTVTNLSAATDYYFAVYEYNGSGISTNYKIDTPAVTNRYTLATEATTASTGGTGSGITTTSITVSWNAGDGATHYVLVKAASPVDADPVDGESDTANAAFGSGSQIGTGNYLVYLGSDTFVTITGLDPNTTYYYEVFEVNGSGESSNYLISPSLTGNEVTLEDAPVAQVSGLSITATTINSMSLSWTNTNSDSVIVIARSVSSLSGSETPVSGTIYQSSSNFGDGSAIGSGYVVYTGTGTSTTVNNLGQDTNYYFAAYTYAGSNGGQAYNTTAGTNAADSNTKFQLDITAMLEGPMANETMDTSLNVEGYVPATQPYSMAPFYYGGSETNNALGANVVDWVMVEIRKAATVGAADSSTRVARVAALILNDGSIVAEDGSSLLTINPSESTDGEMYVVVYHRNHIPVLSANKVTFGTGAFEYNFTSGASQANGTDAMTTVNGKAALWSGNADASGNAVDADDRDAAWDARNNSGYYTEDVNLDGNVDAHDRSITYNNAGKSRQINN